MWSSTNQLFRRVAGGDSLQSSTMNEATRRSIEYTLGLYGPTEARAVLAALENGTIDGSGFLKDNGCGCLIGTLEVTRNPSAPISHACSPYWSRWQREYDTIYSSVAGDVAPTARAQFWFCRILPGETIHTNTSAMEAANVIREWLAIHYPVREVGVQATSADSNEITCAVRASP